MSGKLLALLSRALDQTGEVIAKVRPEHAAMPTPCRSWTVRALVNQVVDEVHQFAVVTAGGKREHLGIDFIGEDWAGAYRKAADELLAAWQPGAFERTHKLPGAELPATWALGQQITELVIHAWDIAKATGQPTDLDPELGPLALDWERKTSGRSSAATRRPDTTSAPRCPYARTRRCMSGWRRLAAATRTDRDPSPPPRHCGAGAAFQQ